MNNITIQFRRLAIRRKYRHLGRPRFIIPEHLNGSTPRLFLAIIDFSQIQNLALNNSPTCDSPILHKTPITMFLAVFDSLFCAQKHANSFN